MKPHKMVIPCFAVCQAIRKSEEIGVKSWFSQFGEVPSIFADEESARHYLENVILTIRKEQRQGKRGEDNLDPEKALDFCITKAEIIVDVEDLEKRGWVFEKP